MPIAYRSVLTSGADSLSAVKLIEQVELWLQSKGCKPGFKGTVDSAGKRFSHFEVTSTEFSAMRWQIDEIWSLATRYLPSAENERHGVTTVNMAKTAENTWIWVDVDAPNASWLKPDGTKGYGPAETEAPKVVRSIIETCVVYDGLATVAAAPLVVRTPKHLDELLAVLEDETRFSAVFVSVPPQGVDSEQWAEQISKITDRSKGVASPYVLDQSMQQKFLELVGFKHSVQAGTMRTFLPGVKPFDSVDSYRHKLLNEFKLQSENFRYLARFLKTTQITRLASAKLPRVLLEADQLLSRAQRFEHQPFASSLSLFANQSEEKASATAGVHSCDESIFWEQIAKDYELEVGNLRIDLEESKVAEEIIDDLNNQLAAKAEERIRQDDLIRKLRIELTKLGSQDAFVLGVGQEESSVIPSTAEMFIEAIDNLPHLVFLGDPEPALRLDEAPNIYPGLVKAWEALLSLSAYATAKSDGKFQGGAKQYMESTTHDGLKISGIKWRESDSVLNNPKFARQRIVNVPFEVEVSGELTFVAHIAFGSKGQNYPRLYFYDAMGTSFNKVIIGYIGEHLDNTLTN